MQINSAKWMALALLLAITVSPSNVVDSKRQAKQQQPIDLMQLLNNTSNYFTSSSETPKQLEAQWAIKRQRFLRGGMKKAERSLYVSQGKAPVFILGAMKGAIVVVSVCEVSRVTGGTTALFSFLMKHPQLMSARQLNIPETDPSGRGLDRNEIIVNGIEKEPRFFMYPALYHLVCQNVIAAAV